MSKRSDGSVKNKPGGSRPPSSAFHNSQLSLFQEFLYNQEGERRRLSNTIELWDGSPKYFISRQRMQKMRSAAGHLPTLVREFKYRSNELTVEVLPARVRIQNDKEQEFYPSAREELVEDALRKIAAEQTFGFLYGQESGVRFTLYMLRQELQRRGHSLSYQQIKESLEVMAHCTIIIRSSDKRVQCRSPILPGLISVNREEYLENPKAKWFAHFSPLVTESIRQLTYRQYNYGAMMAHRTQLARWMHKRLSHHYIQASHQHPYTIRFSTVQRDSGLLEYGRQRDAISALEGAFAELRDIHDPDGDMRYGVILSFNKQQERGARNKILDIIYQLQPNPLFISEVKAANKRQQDAKIAQSRDPIS